MPQDEPAERKADDGNNAQSKSRSNHSWFSVPLPVKQVFDRFPQTTYAANDLPVRAPKPDGEHVLHVFTNRDGAKQGSPSYNPGCLKWQAYLKFAEIPFKTAPSSNHASPNGILPFLSPGLPTSADEPAIDPVTNSKLKRWVAGHTQASMSNVDDVRYDAYIALIDHRIRRAWLFQLYVNSANSNVSRRLYVETCSSNIFVKSAIAHQLRTAAEGEITKSSASHAVVEADILHEFEGAMSALAQLLGENEWFFGQTQPSLFDAAFFSYVHLILDTDMEWAENQLGEILDQHPNLIRHRDRIATMYF